MSETDIVVVEAYVSQITYYTCQSTSACFQPQRKPIYSRRPATSRSFGCRGFGTHQHRHRMQWHNAMCFEVGDSRARVGVFILRGLIQRIFANRMR